MTGAIREARDLDVYFYTLGMKTQESASKFDTFDELSGFASYRMNIMPLFMPPQN